MEIPSGLDHLEMIEILGERTRQESRSELAKHSRDLQMIGTSLSVLFQASTCHRKCHGGPHVLESLLGRAYNLGIGAITLFSRGLYDEALNLVRSVGEISNFVSLSIVDKVALSNWLAADRKTRINEFNPGKVRKILEIKGPDLMYADKDWYTSFCESYAHPTPETKPNQHNEELRSHVGCHYQEAGLALAIGELATVLGFVALPVCKYFKFDDLYDTLIHLIKAAAVERGDATENS